MSRRPPLDIRATDPKVAITQNAQLAISEALDAMKAATQAVQETVGTQLAVDEHHMMYPTAAALALAQQDSRQAVRLAEKSPERCHPERPERPGHCPGKRQVQQRHPA